MKVFFDTIDEIPADLFVAWVVGTALVIWAMTIFLRPKKEWWQ
jgi:hypothetical protein